MLNSTSFTTKPITAAKLCGSTQETVATSSLIFTFTPNGSSTSQRVSWSSRVCVAQVAAIE